MTMESLQAVMDTASEAVFILSEDGQYLHQNAAAQALLGYSLNEIRERHLTDIVETNPQPLGVAVADHRRAGFWNGPALYRHRTGALIWVQVSVFMHALADGSRVMVATVHATERRGRKPATSEALGVTITLNDVRLLQLLAHEITDAQVARLLGVEASMVEGQIAALLGLLGLTSRTEAVVKALKAGVII